MPRIISNFFIIASETITHIKICFYSYKKFIIFFNKLHLQKNVIYSRIAFMKKIAISFFTLIFATSAALADTNPFMGEHNHQIALNVGAGVNSGFIVPPPTQFVPFVFLHFQYSQPTTFFKVPARQSINIGKTLRLRTEKIGIFQRASASGYRRNKTNAWAQSCCFNSNWRAVTE